MTNGANHLSSAAAALVDNYPLLPARFAHALADHPLLTLDALAEAALRLPAGSVERRVAQGDAGSEFAMLRGHLPQLDAHIRNPDALPCWIMLPRIERLPEYRELLQSIIAETESTIAAATGVIRDLSGFVFISAKGSVTPFHFDPEYNLFFQIAGDKRFATFPASPPFVTDAVNEHYHMGGDNMLAWDSAQSHLGTVHDLQPGDGLYVPHKAPHWIEVGEQLSISLSLTWKSDWSQAEAYCHRFNGRLRQWGIRPGPVADWPAHAPLKTAGGRLLDRIGGLR